MSLRIPLTVERCAGADRAGRVRYRHGHECLIPESIVLRRWQERTKQSSGTARPIRFDGCRLPSGTWTLLRAWIADGLSPESLTNPDVLEAYAARNRTGGSRLRSPVSSKYAQLIGFLLEKGVLEEVISRERSAENPGIPDLFLYRVDGAQHVHGGRFVEVKRSNPRERTREDLSPGQRAEIDFLRRLGLRAEVVYLREQGPAGSRR
jgi:VRR-NUC domain